MTYYIDSVRVNLDNLDWVKDLSVSEDYINLMESSGGVSCESRFYVLYEHEDARETPEKVGYLAVIRNPETEESLNLYKATANPNEYDLENDTELHWVERNKVAIHSKTVGETPISVFRTDSGKVYLPKHDVVFHDDIEDTGFKPHNHTQNLGETLEYLGASEKYAHKLVNFFEADFEEGLYCLEPHKESVWDILPVYSDLVSRDTEYRRLQYGNYLGSLAEGLLEGALTGVLFEASAAYGAVVAAGYITKFSPKILNMTASYFWGRSVDKAVESIDTLEELRSVERKRSALFANIQASSFVAMQKPILDTIVTTLGVTAPQAYMGLLLTEEISGGLEDAGMQKASMAIHEELLAKYEEEGYDDKVFQLMGLEETIMGGLYLASYGIGAAMGYFGRATLLPFSLAALGAHVVGKSMWSMRQGNPDVVLDVLCEDYLPTDKGFKFQNFYNLDISKVEGHELIPLDNDVEIGHMRENKSCYIKIHDTNEDWGIAFTSPREKIEIAHQTKFWNKPIIRNIAPKSYAREHWRVNDDIMITKYENTNDLDYEPLADGTLLFGTKHYRDTYKQKRFGDGKRSSDSLEEVEESCVLERNKGKTFVDFSSAVGYASTKRKEKGSETE